MSVSYAKGYSRCNSIARATFFVNGVLHIAPEEPGSSNYADLKAIYCALEYCKEQNIREDISVFSSSSVALSWINKRIVGECKDRSHIERLLKDCLALISSLGNVKIEFVEKAKNLAFLHKDSVGSPLL